MLLFSEKPLIYQVSSTEDDKHRKHLKTTHPVVLSTGYGTTKTLINTISEMVEWLFLFLFEVLCHPPTPNQNLLFTTGPGSSVTGAS